MPTLELTDKQLKVLHTLLMNALQTIGQCDECGGSVEDECHMIEDDNAVEKLCKSCYRKRMS